jgi:hypothetical protein
MATSDKEFDAVRLMRALREEIDRDVAGLSAEAQREYIRARADRVRPQLGLVRGAAAQAPAAAR